MQNGKVTIGKTTGTGQEDCVGLTITSVDGKTLHIRVSMSVENFAKALLGEDFQPCVFIHTKGVIEDF